MKYSSILIAVLLTSFVTQATAANGDDNLFDGRAYIYTFSDGSKFLDTTWALGARPADGEVGSRVGISIGGGAIRVNAYNASTGERFSCYTSSSHYMYSHYLSQAKQFGEGRSIFAMSDASGYCTYIGIMAISPHY